MKNLIDKINENKDYVINLRRYFHENPELSWEEVNTSKRIRKELEEMNIPYELVKDIGVIGHIKGKGEGKRLGIRADIDALPVKEETGLSFASKNEGVMHACGHDAHISILLGAAKILNELKDEFKGEILIIFQPAEEYIQDSGAKYLSQVPEIKSLDRIIGLHIWGDIDSGSASLNEGPIMASADTFDIYIKGISGHGASPHKSIDPIVAGSMVVNALQTIVSRENDPLEPQVISVTAFNSGNSKNVIPETAHLEGTTRSFNNDLRSKYKSEMQRVLEGVAITTRAEIKLDYHDGTPATVNEKESTEMGIEVAKEVFKDGFIEDYPQLMGGEDFAKYLLNIPGCFLLLGGAGKKGKIAQHNEKFDIDEDALKLGVEYFVKYAIKYLK
ncbi:M20 family metallopeptidase [uncultured Peptoniphilus sp.]|uniref:M20 metallopeptidase family protein n=1 Tax=uncultured Peptoniphilus sp. TaxID=254354 RepID=UPI00258A07DE|nr:amidohydrolase [uncultured Peptoniphilus sp.]MDU5570051.1 amidohydrolase [Peptoniphilus harei]MDU6784488.1 amidohydrolase [Peptoniphilus harei]